MVTDLGTQRPVAMFRGPVTCRREPGVCPGLTLIGAAADDPGETLILTFLGAAPEDLPRTLMAPSVVALDGQCYRIASPPQQWRVWARTVYVHRDVTAAFCHAVPPRSVPWTKRLFWRLVLLLAGDRVGRRVLRALRR